MRPTASILPSLAEDEGVVEHLDVAERFASQRRVGACRRRELREVADEKSAQAVVVSCAAKAQRGSFGQAA